MDQNLKDYIINLLIEHGNISEYIYLLKYFEKEHEIINILLNNIKDFSIDEDYFFTENDNEKILFLKEIFKEDFNNLIKIKWFQKVMDTIEKLYQKIIEKKIKIKEIVKLFNNNNKNIIIERLSIIFKNKKETPEAIYSDISLDIKTYKQFFNSLRQSLKLVE